MAENEVPEGYRLENGELVPIKQGIVEATGTITSIAVAGQPKSKLSKVLEDAMSQAVLDCYAAGTIDDASILKAKFEAKEAAKVKFYAELAE